MRKLRNNWVCDCLPPLPDLMSNNEKICQVCKMKKSDIKKRIKETNNNYAVRRYCPKCDKVCMNRRHQSILYMASMLTYWDRDNKGKLIMKYTQAGLKRIASL
jgi:hypothetical protein